VRTVQSFRRIFETPPPKKKTKKLRRKSKSHFWVFIEKKKQSFWGIFGEIKEVALGYFLLKIKN